MSIDIKHRSEEKRHRLCPLDELCDPGTRGFRLEMTGEALELFVVRCGSFVHGYLNVCPHTGVNLDWLAHEFLDADQKWIICATHGALFHIETGECVAGPCVGDRLTPVQIEVVDGVVFLKEGRRRRRREPGD